MGFLSGLADAAAGAGVILKSKGDYERQQELRAQDDQNQASRVERDRIANESGKIKLEDAQRQQQWDRNLQDEFAKGVNEALPVAKSIIENAPEPQPEPQQASLPKPPVERSPEYNAPEAQAYAAQEPVTREAAPSTATGQAPEHLPVALSQPMPASALPGSTFSVAPAAKAAAQSAAPAQISVSLPPPPTATPVPKFDEGSSGVYDRMMARAERDGNIAGYEKLRALKDAQVKEGMGAAAMQAISQPNDTSAIERVFNRYGHINVVPGSLKREKGLTYTGTGVDRTTGKQQPITLNLMESGIALGVIKGPKITSIPAGNTAYSTDAMGNVTKLQEAQKYITTTNARGDVITTNSATGDVKIHRPDGSDGYLSPEVRADLKEAWHLVGREATNRTAILPSMPGYKKPIDQAKVTGDAQSIFLNNPELKKSGLNGAKAAEIAIAIADGNVQPRRLKTADGKEYSGVIIDGIKYKIAELPQTALAPAAPRVIPPAVLKPGQTAGQAAVEPSPAPAAPAAPAAAQKSLQRPPAVGREAEIERFNQSMSVAGRRPGTEAASAQKAAAVARDFPARLSRFSKEDQMWMTENAGRLTNAQRKLLREKQESRQYQAMATR